MRCVTSFGEDGYKRYGRKFLKSYVEHHDVPIWVYYEGDKPDFEHELITYKDLFKCEGLKEYLAMVQLIPAARGHIWGEQKYNYRFDTYKFCRKSFAQIDAAASHTDWLYWIDADVEFNGPIKFPQPDAFMVYLGRPEWHSCTSFIGFNMTHDMAGEFMRRYWLIHVTGTIFCLSEWADPQVLDWLREQSGVAAVNLAEGIKGLDGPANVFDSVFPNAHHAKGNLKFKPKNRYEELLSVVDQIRPAKILEVGTWNGNRAIEMCQWGAEYLGFDLFEEATDETDYEEKNVKKHNFVDDVAKKLEDAGIEAHLVKGNTRETLPNFPITQLYDFAFIDGGHSVETIRSDWEGVKRLVRPGGLIVFDDYYEDMPEEDLEKWGANKVIEGMEYTLSNSRDPVAGGGVTRLAFVEV